MKQLLGMARQKKQKDVPRPMTNLSIPKNNLQPQMHPPSQSQHEQEAYQISEEELIGYAQFLGIILPEEEDLMWIAEEGLYAELPEGWVADQSSEDGEVLYINVKTGEQTYQHPCDEFYKQLVVQQRRKKGGSKILANKKAQPNQPNAQKQFPIQPVMQAQPKSLVIDPLVKMQQEKELRKLEENKKKQYQDKKANLFTKHETKKEELIKELRQKEEKLSKKYNEQISSEKQKEMKKMSEKERQAEEKVSKELRDYESQVKTKLERNMDEKRRKEKEAIDLKIKNKKDEIKRELQTQLKNAKREIDNEFKEKNKIIEQKQKELNSEHQQLDGLLQNEIKKLKNQIIRKKMKEHSQKIKAENDRQKDLFLKEIQQMQANHDQRIAQIQKKQPKNKIKIEELILQCQREESEELLAFNYELQHMKKAKQFELQEKISEFKAKLQEQHRRAINNVIHEYDEIYEKYRNLKDQQIQSFVWEAQKKSKQQYLRSLKALEKKFNTEEEIAIIQNTGDSNYNHEKQSIQKMGSMLDNLGWEEKEARRQLQSIKLEIENIRSQNMSLGNKLNDNQMKLYQLIQDKIKNKSA